jgi:hypothetical protein
MDGALARFGGFDWMPAGASRAPGTLGETVQDLLIIALTITLFAALWLLVKGVERIER